MGDFISDPTRNFQDAHTKLNSYIKVATAAVDFLNNSTTDAQALSERINDLILNTDQRWTSQKIEQPHQYLTEVKNELTKLAIVGVYSSYDVFFTTVTSHLSHHGNKDFIPEKNAEDGIEVLKIKNLYKRLNWELTSIEKILPIFKFYKELRNCVAHNMGYPNSTLITIANSEDFKDAIINWKTKFPKKSISAPPLVIEEKIILEPHHAIMYSDTCLRIAKDIDSKMLIELQLDFFVEKTIKEHLTDAIRLTPPMCSDLTSYIKAQLKADYNISATRDEIKSHFTDWKNLKKHKKRYHTMLDIASQ